MSTRSVPGRACKPPRVASRALAWGAAALISTLVVVVGLNASAAASGAPVGSVSASVGSIGPCSGDSGVTVVVDPGDLGGSVQVRCASESPRDGTEALRLAGFTVEVTISYNGFVCRIDGRPSPQMDRCVSAPPATAYWSYWVADRGGPWCYSDLGATVRTPRRGTIEGWAFSRGGNDSAPRSGTFERLAGSQRLPMSECDRGPAPTTTAAPSAPPRLAPTAPPPQIASATTIVTQPTEPAATAPPETTLPVAAASTTAPATTIEQSTTTTTELVSTTSTTATDDDGEQAASTVELDDSGRSGPGSAAGTAAAVSAMAVLAGGAVIVNRRRLKPLAVGTDPAHAPDAGDRAAVEGAAVEGVAGDPEP